MKTESNTLNLSQFLSTHNLLSVPPEQREYIWETQDALRLVSNLYSAYVSKETDYYLGTVNTYDEGAENQLEVFIIDGQQRITTLYLILMALWNYIDVTFDIPEHQMKELFNQVKVLCKTTRNIKKKGKNYYYKLHLFYNGGNEFIHDMLENKMDFPSTPQNGNTKHLKDNYGVIQNYLESTLETLDDAYDFLFYILDNTEIINLYQGSRSKAFKIFTIINDGGKKLTPLEFLRSTMLANNEDNSDMIEKWSEIYKLLDNEENQNEKNYSEFLTFYLLSSFPKSKNSINKNNLIDFILNKQDYNKRGDIYTSEHTYDDNDLLDDLLSGAIFFNKISNNLIENQSIREIFMQSNGKKQFSNFSLIAPLIYHVYKKHYNAHNTTEFDLFCHNLLVLYTKLITIASSKQINKNSQALFHDVIDNIRIKYIRDQESSKIEDLNNMLCRAEIKIKQDYKNVSTLFYDILKNTPIQHLENKTYKYILAKIYSYANEQSYGPCILENLLSQDTHIEHCTPQSSKAAWVNKIGNLFLLEKNVNTSIQDKTHEEKIKRYSEHSNLLMNKIIDPIWMDRTSYNNDTLGRFIQKIINSGYYPSDKWNVEEIDSHADLYIKILKMIFDNKY